jgi:D-xylulose reductase
MFDIEKSRTDFATSYGADSGHVPPKKEEGKDSLEFAQEYAKKMIDELDVGHGFDVTGKFA